jgi:hypothetical protein
MKLVSLLQDAAGLAELAQVTQAVSFRQAVSSAQHELSRQASQVGSPVAISPEQAPPLLEVLLEVELELDEVVPPQRSG